MDFKTIKLQIIVIKERKIFKEGSQKEGEYEIKKINQRQSGRMKVAGLFCPD